jgi:guanine deaminase
VPWSYILARLDKVYYANTKTDAAAIGFDDNFIYDELGSGMNNRKVPFYSITSK